VLEDCSLAILAGGMGSRFGGSDKQGALIQGVPLGRRVALNALTSGLPVTLVGLQRDIYHGLPLRFIHDIVPGYGPLSGLHAALVYSTTPWVFLLACDMPYFDLHWLSYLSSLVDSPDDLALSLAILAQRESYVEPFQGLYSRSLITGLERKMDNSGVTGEKLSFSGLLGDLPHTRVPEAVARRFSPDWSLFLSINDVSALEAFQGGLTGEAL
jgi:Molybdopterin-guanine dinucleotide biosynthesis protein A